MGWVFFPILLVLAHFVRSIVLPPSNFPKNIPTIPFYVVFVSIVTDWDQEKIFKRYYRAKLEKHGAVKVYFGSRWNILVSRPEYVAQILRNNEVFEKSGNFEKVPHAVLSDYLGNNIISTGNEQWRHYRKIMTNSILFPDLRHIDVHLAKLVSVLGEKAQSNKPVQIPGFLQQFFLACIGDCVIGCNLDSEVNGQTILERVRSVKRQIFRPLYMTFPVLDHLPIPVRLQARVAVKEFKRLLRHKILQERTSENSLRLGSQLANACEAGEMSEKQFEDNAIIALVAGHENPEMLLTTVLYLLAKYPDIQSKLRKKLGQLPSDAKQDLPFLNAVIFECLRVYPPIAQLVNRVTRQPVCLGKDILIPERVYIGTNSFITQRDQNCWSDADSFKPERWGNSEDEIMKKYALAKSKCEFTAFHGRNRACLGEKFALMEIRKSVISILESFEISLDPLWRERITPAGPIWPEKLSVVLKKISNEKDEDLLAD